MRISGELEENSEVFGKLVCIDLSLIRTFSDTPIELKL